MRTAGGHRAEAANGSWCPRPQAWDPMLTRGIVPGPARAPTPARNLGSASHHASHGNSCGDGNCAGVATTTTTGSKTRLVLTELTKCRRVSKVEQDAAPPLRKPPVPLPRRGCISKKPCTRFARSISADGSGVQQGAPRQPAQEHVPERPIGSTSSCLSANDGGSRHG